MRLYLDTNFFIEAIEGSGALKEACLNLLESGESRAGFLVTSLLTLSEVLVHPMRFSDIEMATIYSDVIVNSNRMIVVDIDRTILIDAAKIRGGQQATKLPDAIHLATARALECSHIVSNDAKLRAAAEALDLANLGVDEVRQMIPTPGSEP